MAFLSRHLRWWAKDYAVRKFGAAAAGTEGAECHQGENNQDEDSARVSVGSRFLYDVTKDIPGGEGKRGW